MYFYFQDGFGTSAGLYSPRGLASLPNGDILIADRSNDRIRLLKGVQSMSSFTNCLLQFITFTIVLFSLASCWPGNYHNGTSCVPSPAGNLASVVCHPNNLSSVDLMAFVS
jgi:hypothetical protein